MRCVGRWRRASAKAKLYALRDGVDLEQQQTNLTPMWLESSKLPRSDARDGKISGLIRAATSQATGGPSSFSIERTQFTLHEAECLTINKLV